MQYFQLWFTFVNSSSVEVVMMAAKRDGRSVMRLERMFRSEIDDKLLHHVAGGPHKGILIAKAVDSKLDTPTKQIVDSYTNWRISVLSFQKDNKDFKRYVNELEWHVGIIEIDSCQNFWLIYITFDTNTCDYMKSPLLIVVTIYEREWWTIIKKKMFDPSLNLPSMICKYVLWLW